MTTIHPTAVVDPKAELGDGVNVGPYASIGPGVVLGDDCEVGEGVILRGPAVLGKGNVFYPHCAVGTDPQDLKYRGEVTDLRMGDGNRVREFVTINRGTKTGGGRTEVGNHNLFMACSHVAHDCHLGDGIVMANNVLLGGHIHIHDHANLSGAAAVNHFTTVGRMAFVGGLSRIVQDVPPFLIVEGNPAKIRGVNVVKLERENIPDDRIQALKDVYRRVWKSEKPVRVALEEVASEGGLTEEVDLLVEFIRRSEQGEHGRYLESLRRA
ncbi:MAG: acyl-ACP--UDP-N-acetylglucosamine O-acyltransferase [Planctomycetota bacterium]|jgi:UDP-N-acetylglucosamine acyltransferase